MRSSRGLLLVVGALAFALTFSLMIANSRPARADLPVPRLVPELAPPFKDKGADSAIEADPWTHRKSTVSAAGASPGGPLGFGGVSYEYAPIKYLVLGGGGGYAPTGAKGAIWPRLRLPINRWIALGIGLPLSAGPYEFTASATEQCPLAGCGTGYRTTRTWDVAFWGHIEPNIELRVGPGIALRLYAGQSFILNTKSDRCVSTLARGCPSSVGETIFYGGAALGYAW